MSTVTRLLLPALLALTLFTAVARACPNCKDSAVELIPGRDGSTMSTGPAARSSAFNTSILLMLGGFALTAGSLGFFVVKAARAETAPDSNAQ